ncbi:MAG TPA: hypothetical protein VF461_02755 [Gemmatimonadaceae bacterium]
MPSVRDENVQPHIATLEYDGRRFNVTCKVMFDGIEYVGHLWFADEAWDDTGVPDRGSLPGRTREETLTLARRLTPQELMLRYRRALAEKRRFTGLRKATEDILEKIRYLNQVAISMRAGLLDSDGAAAEIELTERQLHEIVEKLKVFAGIEG